MGHDVFISYSTKDKLTADAACASLEAGGVRCWIAPRDILPGSDWGESIVDAIRGCRVMVLVFSSNANASPQIRREVERAVNKGVAIIPFRIEDVMPTRSLEYFISTPHWMDAVTPPLETHLKKLTEVVRALLAQFPDRTTKTVAAVPTPVARAKEWIGRLSRDRVRTQASEAGSRRNRIPPWALVLALGLALIALAALLPRGRRKTAAGSEASPTAEAGGALATPLPLPPPASLPDEHVVIAKDPPLGSVATPPPAAAPVVARFVPPVSVAEVFECRRGAEFHVSPDEATVSIDGRRIGKADDWDGSGGGRVYYFRRPGTYYARFALRGYRTTWVKIVVRPGAPEEVVDVDTNLPDVN